MILDCFTFFNEIKLLLVRLHYLEDVVDYFVISESDRTFSGHPKPLFLDQYWDAIPSRISRKIIRCQSFLNNEDGDILKCWHREHAQRSVLIQSVRDHFPDPRNVLFVSDVDEIPHKDVMITVKRAGIPNVVRLQQTCLVYNPDTRSGDWASAYAGPLGYLVTQNVSNLRVNNQMGIREIQDAGWHFTFCLSPEKILHKIQAYSHQEFNKPEWANLENIKKSIANRVDLFDRFPGKIFEPWPRDHYPSDLRHLLDLYMPPDSLNI